MSDYSVLYLHGPDNCIAPISDKFKTLESHWL